MSSYRIPFSRPHLTGREDGYLREALTGTHLAGDGPFTARCCRLLEEHWGQPRPLLTPSGTDALEMAALLCEVGPGDEVILPSFTFTSTATAFALRGATLRFVDIRPDTLNLDEGQAEAALTARTRALVPVHYAGVACEMDPLLALAESRGLWVVEDAAHALGATYRGRPLGALGHLGCLSFHESKNLTCGEGGALVVSDERLRDRAGVLWHKGTNREQFRAGLVDKYTWVDLGSSYLLSDLLAAVLLAQLEELGEINRRRRERWALYHASLEDLEQAGCLRRPVCPAHCEHNGHLYYVLTAGEAERQALAAFLAARGILAVFHYVPLHTSPMGQALGYHPGQFPVTEDTFARLLRLPLYYDLAEAQVLEVCAAVREFYRG